MLSTIGRAAVRRVVSRPIATLPVVSRLASRAAAEQSSLGWLATSFARSCAVRSIATTTGKKATAASTKPKTTATKQKKKPVKKKAVKKKAAPKPKKVVKKKKELTQEQKDKLEIKELKEKSLYAEEPKKQLPSHAWILFVSEQVKGAKYNTPGAAAARYSELGQEYKSISSSEHSRLKSAAEENVRKNAAAYKAWVESKPLAQIREANNARNLLKRKFDFPKSPKQKRLIKDERQPKRTTGAFSYYQKARWASGDFVNIKASEATRSLADEWKALSESEKEPYFELAKADSKRFQKESEATQP